MDLDIYYKYKEFIDKILSARRYGSIKIIDNIIYLAKGSNIYKQGDRYYCEILYELNIIFKNIEDDDFYFKVLNNEITNGLILNPMDIYNYYNIQKLNKENKELKETMKNIIQLD